MDAAAATAASPMAFRNSGVNAGEGASSRSFWLRLCMSFNSTYYITKIVFYPKNPKDHCTYENINGKKWSSAVSETNLTATFPVCYNHIMIKISAMHGSRLYIFNIILILLYPASNGLIVWDMKFREKTLKITWMLQSRSPKWTTLPYLSARTCKIIQYTVGCENSYELLVRRNYLYDICWFTH